MVNFPPVGMAVAEFLTMVMFLSTNPTTHEPTSISI